MAQIIQGDLGEIGVTANIALKDPTTLVNDAIAGNFRYRTSTPALSACRRFGTSRIAASIGPTKEPFSGAKTFPEFKKSYYDAAAIVDPQQRIAAFKQVFEVLHETAWAVPICMRGLLCGQSKQISGVVYDAKTHLVYQGDRLKA